MGKFLFALFGVVDGATLTALLFGAWLQLRLLRFHVFDLQETRKRKCWIGAKLGYAGSTAVVLVHIIITRSLSPNIWTWLYLGFFAVAGIAFIELASITAKEFIEIETALKEDK